MINDYGCSPLDTDKLMQLEAMIDRPLRIGKDREWQFERLGIFPGTLQAIAQDDQDLGSGLYKLII